MKEAYQQLNDAIIEIRTFDAVVVIGAGVSFEAGMPLAAQLPALVWQSLDANAPALSLACQLMAIPMQPAKAAIGWNDWQRIEAAFKGMAAFSPARQDFQRGFAALDKERSLLESRSHIALARLVHVGRIVHVVSLNWDTLLEASYRRRYGVDINLQKTLLSKPHGDCLRIEDDWILPHEEGFIPDTIITRVGELAAERPRVLLIVGYSERDEAVVRRLIGPLGERWRVFRIAPGATGEGAIRMHAADALNCIADALAPEPEVLGWEFVTFANQRGLEAAIAGERLGPRDVDHCPRLPHLRTAKRQLELLHVSELTGQPGCGKSISAWQLARDYNKQGWEVLRTDALTENALDAVLSSSITPGWKRVLVVDDAQTFSPPVLKRLRDAAAAQLKVIIGTTEASGERTNSINIPASASVENLAEVFRKRRDEVLPLVRAYDSHVGDEYLAIPIEQRIDEAARSGSPWEFSFILRGGWQHARDQMNTLRDHDRADLMLLIVAVRQLTTLDAGCTLEQIIADATALGRTSEWAESCIARLTAQRVILSSLRYRCLHIQAAAVAIKHYFRDQRDREFQIVAAWLRNNITAPVMPLRGLSWLLNVVLFAEGYWFTGDADDVLLPPKVLTAIFSRCFNCTVAVDRRDAAFVISKLLGRKNNEPLKQIRDHKDHLRLWLEHVESENAYAFGQVLNNVYNDDEELAREIVSPLMLEPIIRRICSRCSSHGYAWGHFLGRLGAAGGTAWRTAEGRKLHGEVLIQFATTFGPKELGELAGLVEGIASYDLDLALECLSSALPALQEGYGANAVDAYSHTSDLVHWVLGHGIFGECRPSKKQRVLSHRITSGIHAHRTASQLVSCRYGKWETYSWLLEWVKQVNREKHAAIVEALDWDKLDKRADGLWNNPCREFRLLLSSLVTEPNGGPVRQWVADHAFRIKVMDPILAALSPEAAVLVVRNGGRVNLAGHNSSDWSLQSWAIRKISEVDKNVSIDVLRDNRQHVVDGLSQLDAIDCEELPEFLQAAGSIDETIFHEMLKSISVGVATEKWRRVLEDERREVRRGFKQSLELIRDHTDGEVKALAEDILALLTKRRRRRKRMSAE